MRPLFLADADLHRKILTGLRRREPLVDILDAQQGGVIGLRDPEVLSLAAVAGRILISHDRKTMPRHFSAFLTTDADHPGLWLVSQELDVGSALRTSCCFGPQPLLATG
jgi:Domain of unknown function (DUF5615)